MRQPSGSSLRDRSPDKDKSGAWSLVPVITQIFARKAHFLRRVATKKARISRRGLGNDNVFGPGNATAHRANRSTN
jgi:hypothetical protein